MKAIGKNKIKKIVDDLQTIVADLELLIDSEETTLSKMDSRQRNLNDRENTIRRDVQSLDIARIQITCSVEDLCKILE